MAEPKTLLKLLLCGLVGFPACTATTAPSVTPIEFASQVAADRDEAAVEATTLAPGVPGRESPRSDEGPIADAEEHDALARASEGHTSMAVDICMDGCFQQRRSLLHCVAMCRPTPW